MSEKSNKTEKTEEMEVNAIISDDLKRQSVLEAEPFKIWAKTIGKAMGIDAEAVTMAASIKAGMKFKLKDIVENIILSNERDEHGKRIPVELQFRSMSFKTDKGAILGVKQFNNILKAPEDMPEVGTTYGENLRFLYYCLTWDVVFECLTITQPSEANQFGYKPKTYTLTVVSQSDTPKEVKIE